MSKLANLALLVVIAILSSLLVGCTQPEPVERQKAAVVEVPTEMPTPTPDPNDVWHPILVGLNTGTGDTFMYGDGTGELQVALYNPALGEFRVETSFYNLPAAQVAFYGRTVLLNFNEVNWGGSNYTLTEVSFEPEITEVQSFECPGACMGILDDQGNLFVNEVETVPAIESTDEVWSTLPQLGDRRVTVHTQGDGHEVFIQLLTADNQVVWTHIAPDWVDTVVGHRGSWVLPH